mgnify:CR=1 FL=1
MLRPRYSRVKLYKDAEKLLGGKGVAKRVVPISAKKTGFDTNEGMYADILAQLGGAYSDKLADKLEKADLAAARRMRDDYLKPQKDWNVETDGTTPDALRAATMPGALTGNVGATYDPNVKPFPGEDLYDGTDTAQGMAAALGAPNAALGSPLDPGQPYAVGTDEEGDDANWMSAPEHAEFYKRAAAEAQAGFDVDNPTGMARVDQGNYGVAKPQSFLGQIFGGPAPVSEEQDSTLAMRRLLMGDTIAKRENKEAIARAIATRDEERAYEKTVAADLVTGKIDVEKAKAPKQTKEYKNAIAMGLTPGTTEFNDYMQKASKFIQDPVNEMWVSNAKSLSKTFDEWTSKGREAPVFISKLGDLRKVLSTGVDQGYGQNFLNAAAGIAERTGIAIDMENLTGAEVAGSLINQLVVPRVKDLGVKPTDKDLQFIVDIFPNINNEKGANDLILQVLELDSKRNIARSDFAASWLKANAKEDPYGLKFNDDLKEFYKGNDIFKEFVPPAWVKSSLKGNDNLTPAEALELKQLKESLKK